MRRLSASTPLCGSMRNSVSTETLMRLLFLTQCSDHMPWYLPMLRYQNITVSCTALAPFTVQTHRNRLGFLPFPVSFCERTLRIETVRGSQTSKPSRSYHREGSARIDPWPGNPKKELLKPQGGRGCDQRWDLGFKLRPPRAERKKPEAGRCCWRCSSSDGGVSSRNPTIADTKQEAMAENMLLLFTVNPKSNVYC
jgi:hypothetical protein